MNILGIGGTELILILIIALVIAGPKRMLQWAYLLGKYTARLRLMWTELMQGLQQEIDAAGVDLKLPKDIPTRRDINRLADSALKPIKTPFQQAMNEVKAEEKAIREAASLKPIPQVNGHAPAKSANRASSTTDQSDALPSQDAPNDDFGTWSGVGKSEN
ncbi:MAG: hypothetical protein H7Y09_01930 [Chitinophagaceae bacterium]|nr:hypothetical protein [Anaerolineae bacterium]